MKITFRLATQNDLPEYTQMLQKTYQDSYTNKDIGLNKDCFSEKIFNTQDTQEYLKSNLEVNVKQKNVDGLCRRTISWLDYNYR